MDVELFIAEHKDERQIKILLIVIPQNLLNLSQLDQSYLHTDSFAQTSHQKDDIQFLKLNEIYNFQMKINEQMEEMKSDQNGKLEKISGQIQKLKVTCSHIKDMVQGKQRQSIGDNTFDNLIEESAEGLKEDNSQDMDNLTHMSQKASTMRQLGSGTLSVPTQNYLHKPNSYQSDKLSKLPRIPSVQKVNSHIDHFFHLHHQHLDPDLVFFYSDPLLYRGENKNLNSFEHIQLSLDQEFVKLVEIIEEAGKDFKIIKQAINFESLKRWIARKPKIIHISCHGDYDQEKQEFYLQFEGTGEDFGIDDRIHQSRLKALLGNDDHGIELAFVSACHSEQIGQVLLDCNIPFVISVNSTQQIADDICLLFSRHLYYQLLQGKSIRQAFAQATATCSGSGIKYSCCCCAHSHSDDCKWKKYKDKYGQYKAHQLHSGICECNLGFNKHNSNCEVLLKFQEEMRAISQDDPFAGDNDEDDVPEPQFFGGFDDIILDGDEYEQNIITFDKKNDVHVLCCCQPDKLHDESMKFMLKCREDQEDRVIFQDKEKGHVQYLNDTSYANQMANIYDSSILIGRNFDIQSIASKLAMEKNNRILLVNSAVGQRKKFVVIKSIQYCIDRGFFKDGAYCVEVGDTNNCHTFLNLLYKKLKLDIDNVEDLCSLIENYDISIVINKCQHILQNKKEKPIFEKTISDFLQYTRYLKLILTYDGEIDVQLREIMYNKVCIQPLKREDAIRFFKSLDKEKLLGDKDFLGTNEIFNQNLTNQELMDIYQTFRNQPQSLLQIRKNLQERQQHNFNNFSKQISQSEGSYEENTHLGEKGVYLAKQNLYKELSQEFPDQMIFLYILSHAPGGISLNDFQSATNTKINFNQKWKDFITRIQVAEDHKDHKHAEQDNKCKDCGTQFNIIQKQMNQELNDVIFTMFKNESQFINNEFLSVKSRTHFFIQYVKMLAKLSRMILRTIRKQNGNNFDIYILSANIDQGLWEGPRYTILSTRQNFDNNDENETFDKNTKPDLKFSVYFENFIKAFDIELLQSIFPKKFKGERNYAVQFFDELYISFVSILIALKRLNDANVYIDQFIDISQQFEMDQVTAKLQLIKASLVLQIDNDIDLSQQLLVQCEEFFGRQHNLDGKLESMILNVLIQIFHIGNVIQANNNLIVPRSKSIHQKRERISFHKNSYKQSNNNLDMKFGRERSDTLDLIQDKNNFQMSEDPEQLKKKLEKTIHDAAEMCKKINNDFCLARLILIYSNVSVEYVRNLSIQDVKDITEELIKACEVFEQYNCRHHQFQCLLYLGQIKFEQDQFGDANIYVYQALETASNQLERKQAHELLDMVMHEIQMRCNNLIVFLISSPLAKSGKKNPLKDVLNERPIPHELDKLNTIQTLSEKEKLINVHFNILTNEKLHYVAKNGCRILVINQLLFGSKNVCAELGYGNYDELTPDKLRDVLKQGQFSLNIDAVFVNIPGAYEVAEVFKEVGVKQVFLFKQVESTKSISMTEFMRYASLEVIKRLIDQQSVHQAFSGTIKNIKTNQLTSHLSDSFVWHHGKQEHSGMKIFNQQSSDPRLHLQEGQVQIYQNSVGPSNVNPYFLPVIGRRNKEYEIVHQLQSSEIRIVSIFGAKGVGKTRLAQQIGQYVNNRGLTTDGFFMLDFTKVFKQYHINKIFQENGLEHLVKSHKPNPIDDFVSNRKSGIKSESTKKDPQILLIYDNVENFKENKSLFRWHLHQMCKHSKGLKIILTSETQFHSYHDPSNVFQFELKALSPEESMEMVHRYSFLKDQNQNKQLESLVSKCQGNPSNLNMLALALRSQNVDQIEITHESVKKNQRTLQKVLVSGQSQYSRRLSKSTHQLDNPQNIQWRQSKTSKFANSSAIHKKEKKFLTCHPENMSNQLSNVSVYSKMNTISMNTKKFKFEQVNKQDSGSDHKGQNIQSPDKDYQIIESEESSGESGESEDSVAQLDQEDKTQIKKLNLIIQNLDQIQTPQGNRRQSVQVQSEFKKLGPVQFNILKQDSIRNLTKRTTFKKESSHNSSSESSFTSCDSSKYFTRNTQIQVYLVDHEEHEIDAFQGIPYSHIQVLQNLDIEKIQASDAIFKNQLDQIYDLFGLKDKVYETVKEKSQNLFQVEFQTEDDWIHTEHCHNLPMSIKIVIPVQNENEGSDYSFEKGFSSESSLIDSD